MGSKHPQVIFELKFICTQSQGYTKSSRGNLKTEFLKHMSFRNIAQQKWTRL